MWDGSPFVSCPKHNGRAHLREPLIGNAGYRSPISNAPIPATATLCCVRPPPEEMEAPCCSRARKANRHRSTRGIGYAIACRFIEEGAAVTVFGSRQETADAAVEKLTAVYPDAKVWGRSCDLTSLEAVTEPYPSLPAQQLGTLWIDRL